MGIYGGSNKNLFVVPSTSTNRPAVASQLSQYKYNLQVNDTTKVASVYRQGDLVAGGALGQTGDVFIGSYNLNTGKFTATELQQDIASANPGSVQAETLKFFQSSEGSKFLRDKASQTVQKGVIDNGGTVDQSQQTSQSITGTTSTATSISGADPAAGASKEEITKGLTGFKSEELQKSVEDGGYRDKYSGGARSNDYYIYPIDMSDTQDRIKFAMYRYVPKKIDVSNISKTTQPIFSGSNQGIKLGQVILPIQPTISDSNLVQWGEDRLNSLEAIAATAAYGAIQGGGDALGESLEGIRDLIVGDNKSIKAALAAAMTGSAINKEFLTRATGGIINPNLELLFQGPSLRNFTFTFDMSARESKEAEEIKKIIRFFKQGMSVKRASSYLFLKSPNIFEIKYENGANTDHPWINKIKTCALQNCSVNYTPAGNYATYEDGAMTQYNMTLTFSEIDPVYDDDYGTDDNTSNIGY
jgi:hypothetical protein